MLGPKLGCTFQVHHAGVWGWSVKITHRHEGEDLVCLYKPVYECLTDGELLDVIDATMAGMRSDHFWQVKEGRCCPIAGKNPSVLGKPARNPG